MVTRSPTSKGCFTKTKMTLARSSWAVAEKSHERASSAEPAEVSTPAAEVEIREISTRIVITTTMNMKTSSSFETTESRSLSEAVMDLRSRPISTQTASSSSMEMSPFMSLSNMVNAASASSELSKADFRSPGKTVSKPSLANVRYSRRASTWLPCDVLSSVRTTW